LATFSSSSFSPSVVNTSINIFSVIEKEKKRSNINEIMLYQLVGVSLSITQIGQY
jgi:hypothetical protein